MLSQGAAHFVTALNPLSSTSLLASLGALGVFLALFAETGLLIGIFLPGDSLLFTAGLLSPPARIRCTCRCRRSSWPRSAAPCSERRPAITSAGAAVPLLDRTNHRFLRRGTERAGVLLAKYGYGKAIVLARFIPVVRTVLDPMAGALDVPVRTFTIWQVIGGVIWTVGVTLAGYALGSTIPSIDTYLLPIIAVIVIVSLIPVGVELLRARSASRDPDGAPDGAEGGSANRAAPMARNPPPAARRS